MPFLSNITEAQWNNVTKQLEVVNFLFYQFFFTLPFYLQIIFPFEGKLETFVLFLCLFTLTVRFYRFYILEVFIFQITRSNWKDKVKLYFFIFYRWFADPGLYLFFIYMKKSESGRSMLNQTHHNLKQLAKSDPEFKYRDQQVSFLLTIMVFQNMMTTFLELKIFRKMSTYIMQFVVCMSGILPFCIFFLFLLIFFNHSLITLGVVWTQAPEADDDD